MTNLDRITGSMGTRVLKVVLEELRSLKPWGEQTSAEQEQTLERVQGGIDDAIKGSIKDLLAGSLSRVQGTLKSVIAKEGVRAVVDVATGTDMLVEDLHDLVDRVGSTCVIVLAGPEEHQVAIDEFYGQVMPDQASLSLEDPEFAEVGEAPKDHTTSPFALNKLVPATCDGKHPSPVCADPNCWQSPDTTVGSDEEDDDD